MKGSNLFQAKAIERILLCLQPRECHEEMKTVTHFSHFRSKIVLKIGETVERPLTPLY